MLILAVAAVAGAAGLTTCAFLICRHLHMHKTTRAVLTPDGYQTAHVIINGRYRPDTIHLQQGMPARIHFLRSEDHPCSERVVFAHFDVERRLPAFQETTVEFVPRSPGTFLFTCQWGMYRGRLVVAAPAKGQRRPGSEGEGKRALPRSEG